MAKNRNLQAGVFTLFYIVSWTMMSEALNLEETKEGACQSIPKGINVNEINSTWMESVSEWYFPVGSRYELYRVAMLHLSLTPDDEEFKRLSEEDLINNGCFKTHLNMYSGIGLLYGFGKDGFSRTVVRGAGKNVMDIILTGPSTRFLGIGRHTVTLTDYRTFIVFSNCWLESDQRSWEVISTTKTLSSEAKQMIEEHVERLGFNPDQYISMNYDNCSI